MNKGNSDKILVFIFFISILAFYSGNRLALIFKSLQGNVLENLNTSLQTFFSSIKSNFFLIGTTKEPLITGVIFFISVWLIYIYNCVNKKNYMYGEEHGTSRWGGFKDIKPLINPDPDLNILLSETERISVDKINDFNADRNKNILVIGGSGSGKSYSQIKPSLMQLHSSYVITDPKGSARRSYLKRVGIT